MSQALPVKDKGLSYTTFSVLAIFVHIVKFVSDSLPIHTLYISVKIVVLESALSTVLLCGYVIISRESCYSEEWLTVH